MDTLHYKVGSRIKALKDSPIKAFKMGDIGEVKQINDAGLPASAMFTDIALNKLVPTLVMYDGIKNYNLMYTSEEKRGVFNPADWEITESQ